MEITERSRPKKHSSSLARVGFCALGLLSTGLGIIGAFLPVLPTTCFMLLALWAFSKSSSRMHRWLWEHERLGASLRRWQEHRCLPTKAKVIAIVSMTASMTYVLVFSGLGWLGLAGTGAFISVGAFFVLRLPSQPPGGPKLCARAEADLGLPWHGPAGSKSAQNAPTDSPA